MEHYASMLLFLVSLVMFLK